ncbi:hypothetical protein Syun_004471 [Stephania yunnanensis]|uniref:Uncharacterized protein n=1 Tax=Stephania yunnanensis TaxID=152371 RepID=A0AAP0Q2K1_9MAGN
MDYLALFDQDQTARAKTTVIASDSNRDGVVVLLVCTLFCLNVPIVVGANEGEGLIVSHVERDSFKIEPSFFGNGICRILSGRLGTMGILGSFFDYRLDYQLSASLSASLAKQSLSISPSGSRGCSEVVEEGDLVVSDKPLRNSAQPEPLVPSGTFLHGLQHGLLKDRVLRRLETSRCESCRSAFDKDRGLSTPRVHYLDYSIDLVEKNEIRKDKADLVEKRQDL